MKLWHGRHVGPLLVVWAMASLLLGGLYYAEYVQPALSELLIPVYAVIVIAALILTRQWFRERARGRNDRRHGDRRHVERRDDLPLPVPVVTSSENPLQAPISASPASPASPATDSISS